MKKVISTALLLVFLFNIIGYKIFFYFLERAADVRIEAKLNLFSDSDQRLITVKIPIKLPYQTNWKDFERIDGEVSVNGKVYRYVKRKVYQDTLILLCVNYKEKAAIQKHSKDFFQKVNDLTSETDKKPVFKESKLDFFEDVKLLFPGLTSSLNPFNLYLEGLHSALFIHKIEIPPRIILIPLI